MGEADRAVGPLDHVRLERRQEHCRRHACTAEQSFGRRPERGRQRECFARGTGESGVARGEALRASRDSPNGFCPPPAAGRRTDSRPTARGSAAGSGVRTVCRDDRAGGYERADAEWTDREPADALRAVHRLLELRREVIRAPTLFPSSRSCFPGASLRSANARPSPSRRRATARRRSQRGGSAPPASTLYSALPRRDAYCTRIDCKTAHGVLPQEADLRSACRLGGAGAAGSSARRALQEDRRGRRAASQMLCSGGARMRSTRSPLSRALPHAASSERGLADAGLAFEHEGCGAFLCPFDEGAEIGARPPARRRLLLLPDAMKDCSDPRVHPWGLDVVPAAAETGTLTFACPGEESFELDSKMLRLSPGTSSSGFPTLTTQCTIGLVNGWLGWWSPTWSALICSQTSHTIRLLVVCWQVGLLDQRQVCGSLSSGAPESNVRRAAHAIGDQVCAPAASAST